MKKSILVFVTGAVLVFGCTKSKIGDLQPATERAATEQPKKEGGEDDDTPIIMHITRNVNGGPLDWSVVRLVNNGDTLTNVTDANGSCTIQLPRTGVWVMKISRQGYDCVYEQLTISDSFSTRTDTLVSGQCQ